MPPRRLPTKGTHPLRNPCSNPTLFHLFCVMGHHSTVMGTVVVAFGGEGGIRTHGRVTPTAVFETARFGQLSHLSGRKVPRIITYFHLPFRKLNDHPRNGLL